MSGSSALFGEVHDTNPASKRELANSAARSPVNSPAPSPRRSSQRLSCSNCDSLLAAADGEYDRDHNHTANPAAYGANGPDGVGTHTFLPIEASNRIAQHVNPTGVGRTNDYVERTPARTSEFAAKTSTRKAEVNIGGRVTYNRTCTFPRIRLKQALQARGRAEVLGPCRGGSGRV
jgi:hypothetical protein